MVNVTSTLGSIHDALMARFRSFLGEAVLRTDEAGRRIVWERGPYFIAVDNPESPGYLSLWFQGPKKIENVGKMWLVPARESDLKGYAAVQLVDVLPKHRGKGLGQELYRQALKLLGPRYKGLASERIHRKNHGQVPKIWKRLGGRETETGDFVADRVTESSQTMRLSDFPDDIQQLIQDFSANEDVNWDAVVSIRKVPVSAFPVVPGDVDNGRGLDYVDQMDPSKMAPLLIVGNQWIDGWHRLERARRLGLKFVNVVDLSQAGKFTSTGSLGKLR